jgi:uncharacterized protein with ParB-like and HNH nuclease domain
MDGQLLTLSKIFTERLFRIPDYQRGYAWSEKQLKDFWSDIQQIAHGHNHYTGVLTLEDVSPDVFKTWHDDTWIVESKSYQPFFIVDGQQRLTTAIILIEVILESISDDQKLNFTEKKDIQRKFIFDSKDNGISRSYIFGYERDNPSYEYLKTKIFIEQSTSALNEETVYTQNLEFAKAYFFKMVSGLAFDELELLYKKVTQQLLFNIFTITEDVDVCVAFETMNNRGKPLSVLELLKNRLIYLSLKFEAEDYERKKLRLAINDCWKTIYHNLGRNKLNPLDDDRFLTNHYITYFGASVFTDDILSSRSRRYHEVDYASDLLESRFVQRNISASALPKDRLTISDIYTYVSSLQEGVRIWYAIFNPMDSEYSDDVKIWLDKLNRMETVNFHPLLLIFFQKESGEIQRTELLKAIERFVFVTGLVRRAYTFVARDFGINWVRLTIELATGKITTEKLVKLIVDETNKLAKNPEFILTVIEKFKNDGFYVWSHINYFLFEYNLGLQSRSKTGRPKIYWPEFNEPMADHVSVEHIYPQHARHPYWVARFSGLNQKQREALRDSVGNLLPLSKPKNSSLSNRPFPEKIEGNQGREIIGYRYGCFAENEVTRFSEWTPLAIKERGLKLIDFMERRWGLDFGSEEQRLKMLDLTFMTAKSRD